MRKKIYLLLVLMMSCHVYAGDANGKFAVKGAGKKTCAQFLSAHSEKEAEYYLYGGWLEGYISSFNRNATKNYDISPWLTTELMLSLLNRHCQQNNQQPFIIAVDSLIKTLFPLRLPHEDQVVEITLGGYKSYYYVSIIEAVKARLNHMGYSGFSKGGGVEKQDIALIGQYQKKMGFKQTGVPDQLTMMSLFYKPTPQ